MQAIMQLINEHLTIFVIVLFAFVFLLSRARRLVDPVLAIVGYAMLTAFLGFMIVRLGDIDLIIVVAATLVLTAADFIQTLRSERSDDGV